MEEGQQLKDPGEIESDAARRARRAAWAAGRNSRYKKAREARRQRLLQNRQGIDRAVDAYADLDRGDAQPIRIRRPFIRLPERRELDRSAPYADWRADDLKSRPPLTRLINRTNNCVPVLLSAIYLGHLTHPTGAVPNNWNNSYSTPNWVTLTGLDGPDRPRRRKAPGAPGRLQERGKRNSDRANKLRKLTRALGELEKHRLIAAGPRTAGRFNGWTLLREDRSGHSYEVPGIYSDPKDVVFVPYWIFRNGWHLVLEPGEMAVLLAVIERTQTLPRRRTGIGMPITERWDRFGITDEMYESIHQLADFGLIETVAPKALTPGSEEPMPWRLFWPPRADDHTPIQDRPAVDIVLEDLAIELPERLDPGPRTAAAFKRRLQASDADSPLRDVATASPTPK